MTRVAPFASNDSLLSSILNDGSILWCWSYDVRRAVQSLAYISSFLATDFVCFYIAERRRAEAHYKGLHYYVQHHDHLNPPSFSDPQSVSRIILLIIIRITSTLLQSPINIVPVISILPSLAYDKAPPPAFLPPCLLNQVCYPPSTFASLGLSGPS